MQNIRFRKAGNHFQKKVKKDIQLIKSSDHVTFADKKNKPLPINNSGTQSYDKQHHNLEIQESRQKHKKPDLIDGKQILKNREVLNRLV